MDTLDRREELLRTYLGLVASYIQGFGRFASGRIAALSLGNVVIAYRMQAQAEVSGHPYADVLRRIEAIKLREFEAFDYLSDLSSLVYLTTLLDTFLSDTTKFLLLLHPRAIGTGQTVSLEAILDAKSTSELVSDAAAKKTREVSYLPFTGRIDFLRQRFGLRVDLDDASIKQLEHYSSLRNAAIHDQAVFDCAMGADGRIVLQQKTCPQHPTAIQAADVRDAERAYRVVVRAVLNAVVGQVLKASDHPSYKALSAIFDRESDSKGAADITSKTENVPLGSQQLPTPQEPEAPQPAQDSSDRGE